MLPLDDPEKQKLINNTHGIVNPDALDAFLDAIQETIDADKILGTKNIVVTTGNEVAGMSRHKQQIML